MAAYAATFTVPLQRFPSLFYRYQQRSFSHSTCCSTSTQDSNEPLDRTSFSSTSSPSVAPSIVQTPRRFTVPLLTPLFDLAFTTEHSPSAATRLGPIYRSRNIINRHALFIADLEAIAQVFRDTETFTSYDVNSIPAQSILGSDSLLFLDGPAHSALRSKVQPAFLPAAMPLYFNEIQNASQEFWGRVSESVKQNGNCRLKDMIKEHFLRVIIRVTGGTHAVGREEELKNLFEQMMRGIFAVPGTPRSQKGIAKGKQLTMIIGEMIEKTRTQAGDLANHMRDDEVTRKRKVLNGDINLMTLLCLDFETGTNVDTVARLVLLIWVAGYLTQSNTLTCAIAKLTDDVKQRLVSEQHHVRMVHGERLEIQEMKPKIMPVLDAYLEEIMRLYPPLAAAARKALKTTQLNGHIVEEGTTLQLDLFAALRNERYFSSPSELDIDRLLRKDGDGRRFRGWAFGVPGTPHYCMGQSLAKLQMMCIVSEMLHNWEIGLVPNQNLTVKLYPEVMPSDGCLLDKCERRQEAH